MEKKVFQSSKIILTLQWKKLKNDTTDFPELISDKWLVLGNMPTYMSNKNELISLAEEAKGVFGDNVLPVEDRKIVKIQKKELYCNVVRKTMGLPPSEKTDFLIADEKKPIISYAGRKIFIGGIKFDDITKKVTDGKLTIENSKIIIMERINYLKKIFQKFGTIEKYEETWEKGYTFIVFQNKNDAKTCLSVLKNYKLRRSAVKEIRKLIKSEGKDPDDITPDPKFYLRWPSFYQRMMKNRRAFLLRKRDKKKK